jgi:hypothetical protein
MRNEEGRCKRSGGGTAPAVAVVHFKIKISCNGEGGGGKTMEGAA